MQFSPEFLAAFNHSMLYEVGPWWNPNDPDVISGQCLSKEQRKKVGYVNIKQDRGGLTKYGIAINSNPEVDVQNLNLNQAMEVYFRKYWLASKSNLVPYPAQIMHYDVAVNHGVGRAVKMLQEAVGALPDGALGPVTLAKVGSLNPNELLGRLNKMRVDRFHNIVRNNPSQAMFLNGWLRRASEVYNYALAQLR